MADHAGKKEFNTVWKFHCDAQKREYSLTIEYHSDLPPAEHEKIHRKIKEKAADWLIKKGVDPGKVQIDVMRIPHILENEGIEVPPWPVPIPTTDRKLLPS